VHESPNRRGEGAGGADEDAGDEYIDDDETAWAVHRYWLQKQSDLRGQRSGKNASSSSQGKGSYATSSRAASQGKQGKGKGKKGQKGKKGKGGGKHPDIKDSMRLSGLLRHGNVQGWKNAPHAMQELGGYGEIRISTAARLLGMYEDTIERIALTSIHPSGDYRYELMEWDGEIFVRAVRGHSLVIHNADDMSGPADADAGQGGDQEEA
jgi:hypothetical protein